ncbi:lytic transglycosylase [Leucothrix mucor]|uniref:lytic transglycosylase n=1 Tax=Leucothrix mucor TaxID=45248 RepID=UPI0003B77FDF|nr:lytic transglycosylase [Leucothrix mucor]
MNKFFVCLSTLAVMLALSPVSLSLAETSAKSAKSQLVSKQSLGYKQSSKRRKKPRRVFTCDQYGHKTLIRKSARFRKTINQASRKYNVSPHFITAVIAVESCFNPRARGGLGEKGLMQLMPGTARELGVKNGYNPWQNIHGGTRYLRSLLDRYNGNKHFAAAAYNGGPGAVSKVHGPKFKQVKRYSRNVMRAYNTLSKGRKYKKRSAKTIRVKARKAQSKRYTRRVSIKKAHHVKTGHTLYSIARANNTTVAKLKRLNRLKSNTIKVGSKIRLR